MLIEDAKASLRMAFRQGRLSHAYIISGNVRGSAADLAVYLMQLLTCKAENGPCGVCGDCQKIAAGTWFDSLWISPAKKSRIISVQQLREGPPDSQNPFSPPYLLSWLGETSFTGGYKFGIIRSADRMNASAGNAILKMLEEPPPGTVLLLLTDAPQQLIPTIVSRCNIIEITERPPELEEKYFKPLFSALLGTRHNGAIAAMALASQILAILSEMKDDVEKEIKEDIADVEDAGVDVDSDERDALIASTYREKRSLLIFSLIRYFRDLMVLRAGGGDDIVHYSQFLNELKQRANNITFAQATLNIKVVEELSKQLDKNIQEQAIFPYLLEKLSLGGE